MKELKISCAHCQQHIAFPESSIGQVINCPSCGLSVALIVPGLSPAMRERGISRIVLYAMMFAGALFGYTSSYFGQSGLLRFSVPLGSYLENAGLFLMPNAMTNAHIIADYEMLKSAYITAWAGVLIGIIASALIVFVLQQSSKKS